MRPPYAIIAVLLQSVPAFAALAIFPRAAAADEYATWSVLNAAITATSVLIFEHLRLSAIRFGAQSDAVRRDALAAAFLASCAATLLWAAAVNAGWIGLGARGAAWLAAAFLPGQALCDTLAAYLRARGQGRAMFLMSLARVILVLLASMVLFRIHATWMVLASVFYGPSCLVAAATLLAFSARHPLNLGSITSPSVWRSVLEQLIFAYPVVIANGIYGYALLHVRTAVKASGASGSVQFLYISDFVQRGMLVVAGLIGAITLQWVVNAAHEARADVVRAAGTRAFSMLGLFVWPAVVGVILEWRDVLLILTPWGDWTSGDLNAALIACAFGVYCFVQFWLHNTFIMAKRTAELIAAAAMVFVSVHVPTALGFSTMESLSIGLLAGLLIAAAFLAVAGGETLRGALDRAEAMRLAMVVTGFAAAGTAVRHFAAPLGPMPRLVAVALTGATVLAAGAWRFDLAGLRGFARASATSS